MKKYLPLLFLLFLSEFPAFSQDTINQVWLENLVWRSVGPTRGGRSTAICGIPAQPFTFFMGSTGGGVWKTDDAGTTWENISDGQIKAGSIGAIAVADSDPNVMYVGTGSACPRGNVSAGIGLYKSTDGGKSWNHSGLRKAGQIGKIIVHPNNPDWVYVAALGNIFAPNPERGVYRSQDGGSSWEQVLSVSDSTGAVDLSINPDNPREIYAAMWRAERKPWTMIDGGEEGGIWKTTNGGDSWVKLGGGLPTGLLGKIGLAVSPANPNRVWAIIIAAEEEKAGLYRTDDAGKTWERICRDHKLRQRGWYYAHVTAHPTDENALFICNVDFWKSTDGGKSFDTEINVPHGDNHGLWINPNSPKIMIQCNDGGATVTLNGGKTWSSQLNQPTSEFYRLTVDNQFPYHLYAGQQDNSTIRIPSHEIYGVTPTQYWRAVGGSECGDVAVDPLDPDIVWAGSYSGEITISNLKTEQERQVTAYPHYTEGTEQRNLKYRWQWNFPILASIHEPGVVYHTSNFVHRTADGGQSWQIISPDLTRKLDQYHDIPGGPIQHDGTGVEIYSTIFAFEESPLQAGEFWAGTDDGLLHLTRDGGKNWEMITPPAMPQEGTVNKIELSVHSPGRAFVAVYHYRFGDFSPYLFRTDDYGKTWTSIVKGIPENHFVRTVAEDPVRKGLLYAGTEYGAYISFNNGQHWQSLQGNLPQVPITDMEVQNDDLVISTQGRAFWILDDLSSIRELGPSFSTAANHLFQPRPTYRTWVKNYEAGIHFFLAEAPDDNEEFKLEIKDEQGQLVRTLSSKSENKRDKIKVKKGMNTIKWDMKHYGPELVPDLVTMVLRNPSPGPWVTPGKYMVDAKFGDWKETTELEVLPDPRWKDVSIDDYQAQLKLGLEIREMITTAHHRIINLREAREQINNSARLAVSAGFSLELQTLAAEISKKLTAVEDQLIQNKAEASQDAINYPRVFSNHIGRLYGVVTGEQQRPTAGMLERYEDLKVEYENIMAEYKKVVEAEIPRFHQKLEQEKVPRVVLPREKRP